MGKDKLRRWEELKTFERVYEPELIFPMPDFFLKGKWSSRVFKNSNPLVLELGCGRGEYTVNLAKNFPAKNYIGIDVKGARLWRGAKTSHEENINNAAFLRVRIELIESFFAQQEISEIWLTFPDPQLKKVREHRRLTHPGFMERYKKLLKPGGLLHLKTDSETMYDYTRAVLQAQKGTLITCNNDLYGMEEELYSVLLKRPVKKMQHESNSVIDVKTTYEMKFLKQEKKIFYLKFQFGQTL